MHAIINYSRGAARIFSCNELRATYVFKRSSGLRRLCTGFNEKHALPDHPFLSVRDRGLVGAHLYPRWHASILAGMGVRCYSHCCLWHLHVVSGATRSRATQTPHRGRDLVRKRDCPEIIVFLLFVVCTALVVVSPLDFRFGWSSVPWYVSVIGDALIAFSFYIFYLVSKVNTYAAANVRVEEGQQVVSNGMYALVRHPMYLGALFLVIGTPFALGSWWALLLVPLSVPGLYFRIANEEKVLMRGLPGYTEYTQRVRYRLIPYIW